MGIVNNCPLYRKYKTLGAGDCGWCTGIRQYYPAVERFPTSFVEERLYRKFYKFLSELPRFTLQVDLCYDVALALAYLHSNDIIATSPATMSGGRRAKLTCLGMMKFSNKSTMKHHLTMFPGAQVYMSLEALHDPPAYRKKLDCFSFGVLDIQID